MWESKTQKLLRVIINRQLNFDEYLIFGKKLGSLAKLVKFLSLKQRKILMKSFIESKFGYCSLKWMFCGKKTNPRINHVHQKALIIVYINKSLCFDKLLKIDKSHNKHHKNTQLLATELYKVAEEQFIKSNAGDF